MKTGVDCTGIAVGFYCHDGNGFFVFHKRSENCRDERGTWTNGGGKLEFGESPETALLREIKEEYGCDGVIERTLPPQSFFQTLPDGTGKHWITLPYIVRVSRDEAKLNEPESMTEIGWFRLNDVPEPLHTATARELRVLAKYFEDFL